MHLKFGRTILGAALALALVAPMASAATYAVDGAHSSAIFKVQHFGVSNFYGMFKGISGNVEYDPAHPETMAIQVSLDAASVDSRSEQRDNHIKSPDFLNATEFQAITFESTSVTAAGEGGYEVVGKLTLHGVSREITVTAEKVGQGKNPRSGDDMVGFETKFSIDRTDYDMNFMAGPLGTEITFLLSLEAGKAEN